MHERGRAREEMFEFKMSVEAILKHFETSFACEIRLIVQKVAVFKRVTNPHHLRLNNYFDPSGLFFLCIHVR